MSDLRRAALTLHALTHGDRAWMLERVEPAQRRALESLLTELANLGIPPDAAILQQAMAASRDGTVLPARAVLDALAPEQAGKLLAGEPAALVARVLAARAWPWREAFLGGLDAGARRRLGEAGHEAALVSPALDDWLLEDLARRARAPGTAPAAGERGAA